MDQLHSSDGHSPSSIPPGQHTQVQERPGWASANDESDAPIPDDHGIPPPPGLGEPQQVQLAEDGTERQTARRFLHPTPTEQRTSSRSPRRLEAAREAAARSSSAGAQASGSRPDLLPFIANIYQAHGGVLPLPLPPQRVKVEDTQPGDGHRSGHDTPDFNTSPTADNIIDEELKKYMNPKLKKSIAKESKELLDKIRAMRKTSIRVEKTKSDIAQLRAGHLPPGFRKAPHAFETELLDSKAVQDLGIEYQFIVDTELSVRENKEAFRKQALAQQCCLDLGLLYSHYSSLQSFVKRKAFITRCLRDFTLDPSSDKSSMNVLGIPDDSDDDNWQVVAVQTNGQSETQVRAHLCVLYKRMVDKEAENVMQQQEGANKQRERQKAFIQRLSAKTPKDYLKETVSELIHQGFKSKGKGKSKGSGKQKAPFSADTAGIAVELLQNPSVPGNTDEQQQQWFSNFVTENKGKNNGKGGGGDGKGSGPKGGKHNSSKGKGKGKGAKNTTEWVQPQQRSRGRGRGRGRGRSAGRNQNGRGRSRGGRAGQHR